MRLRVLRLISIGALVMTACTGAVASSATSPVVIDGTPQPPVSPAPAACPHSLPNPLPRHAMPGVASVLVPPTPGALVICVTRTRTVVDPQQVPGIVRQLNRLERVKSPHIFACPANLGPTYALFFDYADGTRLLVTVDSSGCRFATNGRIIASADTRLLRTIHRLVA